MAAGQLQNLSGCSKGQGGNPRPTSGESAMLVLDSPSGFRPARRFRRGATGPFWTAG